MAGRPRKPTKLHIIEGTLRPDRHKRREDELELADGTPFPEPPDIVTDDPLALQEWARIVQSPKYAPVLAPEFMPLVVEYCCLTSQMLRSYAACGEPLSVSARQHLNILRQQLGLSPASQSKVKLPPKKPAANEFDDVDIA